MGISGRLRFAVLRRGTTTLEGRESTRASVFEDAELPALVLVWSHADPGRVGEVLLPVEGAAWFGRQTGQADEQRLALVQQRPGQNGATPPLDNPFLSRRHLRIEPSEDGLSVECHGKRPLLVGEAQFDRLQVLPGDVFELQGLCMFLCVTRPARLDAAPELHKFGRPDAFGIVGESPAAWELRQRIAFAAGRDAHVLVTGPTGTGKELVARAVHARSRRRAKPLISRNASTFPASLIDAELFGNVANYPNVGMPERAGLIGHADGSTLFFDEIGELSPDLQAHLLRVLDSGEYQMLGDARPRVADFRLIAATNRDASELKLDLSARLALRIEVPGLGERIEDVPLLARHIMQRIAGNDPQIGQRYLQDWDGHRGEPRFSPELIRALVMREYTAHVRELEGLLWRSIQTSRAGVLEPPADLRPELRQRVRPTRREVSADELRAALARHAGVKDKVWRELGLSSRHALHRLMKKLGEA